MNAKNAMLCWNPESSEVALVPWPDRKGAGDKYACSTLACNFSGAGSTHHRTVEERKLIVFIEAMHLIIRDKVDPMAVHNALLDLDEYLDGCADDMPGVWERRKDV